MVTLWRFVLCWVPVILLATETASLAESSILRNCVGRAVVKKCRGTCVTSFRRTWPVLCQTKTTWTHLCLTTLSDSIKGFWSTCWTILSHTSSMMSRQELGRIVQRSMSHELFNVVLTFGWDDRIADKCFLLDLCESLLAVGRPIGNFVQMFWSNVADSSPSSSPMSLSVTPSLFHSELKTYIYSKKIFHHGHPHPSVLTDFWLPLFFTCSAPSFLVSHFIYF